MEFKRLRKAVAKEYADERKAKAFYVAHGDMPAWAEEHREDRDKGLREYSTAKKWDLYQAGTLSRKQAIEIATARAIKGIDKQEAADLHKIATAEEAPTLLYVSISVEWKRSSMWGYNPTVEATTNDGRYYGSASGCGYDKESTAIAEALNQSPAVLKLLYTMKEKGLGKPPKEGHLYNDCAIDKEHEFRNTRTSSHSIIGYGSGYGTLPYLEGGVGRSCFASIFKKVGFSWNCTASGKTFDAYHAERKRG